MLNTFNKDVNKTKKELAVLLQEDPEFVFETVFKLYYHKLFQIAKIYLNNKEDAEEITQNIFLKFWNNIDQMGEVKNLNNYLFILTKNACLNFLKRRKIRFEYQNSRKETIQIQYLRSEAESLLLENELRTRIDEAISFLPEKCKIIFIQSRFKG